MKQVRTGGEQDFTFAIIFGALGLFGGITLLVADQSSTQRENELARKPNSDPQFRTIARVMALIGLVISIMPVVGVVFCLAALAANIRHKGWPRIVSSIGVAIGIVVTGILFTLPESNKEAEQGVGADAEPAV
ncbi:hypothetical protein [Luteolibacter sp. AS25]|uniref:hypothetical protein n=1 Tax=Luteolibacter sp. AS25 TaxID=3135776 RepID=UPI00398B184D